MGTAVGDALGLPAEGMSPAAIERRGWKNDWKHRLLPGGGMWSDDTEHTIMLSQALLEFPDDVDGFEKAFAWELRCWLLGLPAGVGLATARSILKLWMGIPPRRSGVFSAGNGPCMRAAIVGAFFAGDPERRKAFTQAHTRITHTDPKALVAASAVAELAAMFATRDSEPEISDQIVAIGGDASDVDWKRFVAQLNDFLDDGHSMQQFLSESGIDPSRGVSGYAYHTIPAVLFAGMTHGWRIEPTLNELFNTGGDTDTAGAIAGALCGALHGAKEIPVSWIEGIREWPVTTRDLARLTDALAERSPVRIRPRWSPLLVARNLFFLAVVLVHGLSRPFLFLIDRSHREAPIATT